MSATMRLAEFIVKSAHAALSLSSENVMLTVP